MEKEIKVKINDVELKNQKMINWSLKKFEIDKIKNLIASISKDKKKIKEDKNDNINFEIFDLEYDYEISNFVKKFLYLYTNNNKVESNNDIFIKIKQLEIGINFKYLNESISKFIKIINSFKFLKNFFKLKNYKDYIIFLNDFSLENFIYYENLYSIKFVVNADDIKIEGNPKKSIEKKMILLFENKVSKYNLIDNLIEQISLNVNSLNLIKNLFELKQASTFKCFCLLFKTHNLFIDFLIKNYLEYLEEENIINYIYS